MVYPALIPLMCTTRLPIVDWTDAPADLNRFVRFAERRNLVSARLPSHFKRSLKADSHIACRAHAVPLLCRAAKCLECVFPIWFTQCGCVWFIKMWSVTQTRPHCVNQMGKAHSKPLAARHGRGTAWARHAMCESALTLCGCNLATAGSVACFAAEPFNGAHHSRWNGNWTNR
jgi:hypothetical protein